MRKTRLSRKTTETRIEISVNLDGEGTSVGGTGVKFFDHLINTLAVHSQIDITINAEGDLTHHIIEDIAICLGKALRKAIGEGVGIERFGYAIVPMDDALAFAAIDLVQRPYCKVELDVTGEIIEDTEREDVIHFLTTLASSLQGTIHVWVQHGTNDHHKIEAAFKAFALSLKQAVTISAKQQVASAKGTL